VIFEKKIGYKRGKKKGIICYRLKSENVRKRDIYAAIIIEVNDSRVRRVVYIDESYIHKNYCCHDDSLYDLNNQQDLETKA